MTVSATLGGVFLKGVAASRPAANAVAGGTVYSATDTGVITQSDGSSWSTWATISAGLADPMSTRGDVIVRNASNVTARLAVGANLAALRSDGTDVGYAILPGTLLALGRYAPSASTVYTSANSATIADVDATNMIVTFTAPASGNVLVRLTALGDATTDDQYWGLRESTTNLGGGRAIRGGIGGVVVALPIYLTGISAGSHTYKWAFANAAAGGGSQRILVQDGIGATHWPPAFMEVIAL